MNLRAGTNELPDLALERELRSWLRSFDPGSATPSLRFRVSVAAAAPLREPSPWWPGLGALRRAAGFAAAAGLLVLAAVILATFSGPRAGVGAPSPEPSILPTESSGAPSALWWLPAAFGGVAAAVIAFVAWPVLRAATSAFVSSPAREKSPAADSSHPFDRLAGVAIGGLALLTAAAWLTKLALGGGAALVFDWNFAPLVALILLPVPIVLRDPSAWRTERWLVAGAALYPAATALRMLQPPAAEPMQVDGGTIVNITPAIFAEVVAAVAPLVLAVGIARWLRLGRGVPRPFGAAVLGGWAAIGLVPVLTPAVVAWYWPLINALLVGSELALAVVGISAVVERVATWAARWTALAGVAVLVAIVAAHAAQALVYAAGPVPNPSAADSANALYSLQTAAYMLHAVALFIAFVPLRRPRVSWSGLRTAGLMTSEAGPGPDPSDEPLPREDR